MTADKNNLTISETSFPASPDAAQEEENVLLLTLSTMGNTIKMSKYQEEQGEDSKKFYCTGISQLEPGTKLILYKLAKAGKKLNRIVIVESEETRKKEVSGIAEAYGDNSNLEYKQKKAWHAVSFYKQRILDYIQRKYDRQILSDETNLIENYDEFERHFPDGVSYSDEELHNLFYDIPTTESCQENDDGETVYQEQSLPLFMEIIRGIKGETGKRINLYIDTQGGARSAIQQINAVVELLKERNVKICGRYAIPKFRPGEQEKIHMIKEVGESYKAYELVASMTEFKSYGRGSGLTAFFEKDTDPVTQQILGIINRISGAIALCNIDLFDKALKDMKSLKNEIEDNTVTVESQIRLVFQDIINDYSVLLKDERTEFDIVEWCVKKHYYQQAITIIESRMPEMLVECGLLSYNKNDTAKNIEKDDANCQYPYRETCNINELCKKMKVEWKKTENYLFEQWIYSNERKWKKTYFGATLQLDGKLAENWQEKYPEFNECERVSLRLREKDNKYFLFKYERFDENVSGSDPNSQIFRMFAALSSVLKDARNGINHANSKLTDEQIKDALETYVILGKELKLTDRKREVMENKFVNFSNHKSKNWDKEQISAAEKFGAIVDIPFPLVDPVCPEEKINELGQTCYEQIMSYKPKAVMCQGEFTLAYNVICRLKQSGVLVVAACSKRCVEEKGGVKTSIFRFVRFREYI